MYDSFTTFYTYILVLLLALSLKAFKISPLVVPSLYQTVNIGATAVFCWSSLEGGGMQWNGMSMWI